MRRTERERVPWPVYLDNPTCCIRIEKGSRSLSLFLANHPLRYIVKSNLDSEKKQNTNELPFSLSFCYFISTRVCLGPWVCLSAIHSLWPKGILALLFWFFFFSLSLQGLSVFRYLCAACGNHMQILSVIIWAQYSDWSVKRFGICFHSPIFFLWGKTTHFTDDEPTPTCVAYLQKPCSFSVFFVGFVLFSLN